MNIESIIEQINNSSIHSLNEFEDAKDIDWPEDAVYIDTLDHNTHSWYRVATMVYKIGDRFLGVKGPVAFVSESIDFSGTEPAKAFEMEAVPSVTYKTMSTTEVK